MGSHQFKVSISMAPHFYCDPFCQILFLGASCAWRMLLLPRH